MADPRALAALNAGRDVWHKYYIGQYNAVVDELGLGKSSKINPNIIYEVLEAQHHLDKQVLEKLVQKIDLSSDNFDNKDLSQMVLKGVNFKGSSFRKTNLKESNISYSDLQEADMEEADLSNSYFVESRLCGANIRKAILKGTFAELADLSGAFMQGADLSDANLESALLCGTNLEGAFCYKTKFAYSDMGGAFLLNAFFCGADLQGVKNLGEAYYLKPEQLIFVKMGRIVFDQINFNRFPKFTEAQFEMMGDEPVLLGEWEEDQGVSARECWQGFLVTPSGYTVLIQELVPPKITFEETPKPNFTVPLVIFHKQTVFDLWKKREDITEEKDSVVIAYIEKDPKLKEALREEIAKEAQESKDDGPDGFINKDPGRGRG